VVLKLSEAKRNVAATVLVFCLCVPYVFAINRTATTALILAQGAMMALATPVIMTLLAKRQKCLIATVDSPGILARRITVELIAISAALLISVLVLRLTSGRTFGQLLPIHLWTAILPVYVLFSFLTALQFVVRPRAEPVAEPEFLSKVHALLRGERLVLDVAEIDMFASENHETVAYIGEKEFICEWSLVRLAQRLDPKQFIRCHRSFIVNVALVKSFPADLTKVVTVSGRTAAVSKRCRTQLKKALRERAQ
jgi:hypothetical protein